MMFWILTAAAYIFGTLTLVHFLASRLTCRESMR